MKVLITWNVFWVWETRLVCSDEVNNFSPQSHLSHSTTARPLQQQVSSNLHTRLENLETRVNFNSEILSNEVVQFCKSWFKIQYFTPTYPQLAQLAPLGWVLSFVPWCQEASPQLLPSLLHCHNSSWDLQPGTGLLSRTITVLRTPTVRHRVHTIHLWSRGHLPMATLLQHLLEVEDKGEVESLDLGEEEVVVEDHSQEVVMWWTSLSGESPTHFAPRPNHSTGEESRSCLTRRCLRRGKCFPLQMETLRCAFNWPYVF